VSPIRVHGRKKSRRQRLDMYPYGSNDVAPPNVINGGDERGTLLRHLSAPGPSVRRYSHSILWREERQ
jgi:hypothetical protein